MNGWGEGGREPEDGGSVRKNEWGQEFEACHFILARGTKEQPAGFKHLNSQRVKMVQRVERAVVFMHAAPLHTH